MMSLRSRLARKTGFQWPIAWILTLAMAGVILTVITVTTLLEIRQERNLFRQDLEARGRLLADTLNDVLADPLYFLDVAKVKDVTFAVETSQDELRYIQVFRADGSLLTDTLTRNEPGTSLAAGFVNSVIQSQEPVLEFDDENLEVTSPIMDGNQLIGVVHFDLSADLLNAHLINVFWDQVWQGLVLLAGATLLAFAVARYVTRPLQALRTASLKIGSGDLDYLIPVGGPEETASLGQALDSMRTELKGLYQDLEGEVEKRTQELAFLVEISRILSQLGDFESKATDVMDSLAQLTRADWVTLRLPKEEEPGLHLVAAAGPAVSKSPSIPVFTEAQTLSMAAFAEGRTIVVDDYAAQPAASQFLVDLGMQSMVILPVKSSERTLGLVTVISKEKGHFTPELVRLLAAVGEGLGSLLENAQLDQQLRSSREELLLVDEVARVITSTLDIQHVYGEFAQQLGQLVDFDRVAIAIVDRDTGTYEYKYIYGLDVAGRDINRVKPMENTRAEMMLMTDQTLVVTDISSQHQYPSDPTFSRLGLRAVISTPLKYGSQMFGALYFWSKKVAAFGPREQAIIERLANQVAPAVRNAELFEKSRSDEEAMRASEEETSVMSEIARIVNSSLDIDEVYQQIGREVGRLIKFDRLSINLIDQENEIVTNTYVTGIDIPELPTGLTIPVSESSSALTATTKKTRLIQSIREEELAKLFPLTAALYRAGLRSFMAVPLISQGEVVAVLSLQSKEANAFSDGDVRVAELIGTQVAGAIANGQLYTERARLASENLVMAEIGRIVNSSLDIDEVYQRIGREVRKLIDFDRISINMIDRENELAIPSYVTGIDIPALPLGLPVPLSAAPSGIAVRTKATQLILPQNEQELAEMFPGLVPVYEAGLKSFVLVPLISQLKVVATMHIQSTKANAYREDDVRVAELVGGQVANAIANARLYSEVKRAEAALRDGEERFRQMAENVREVFFLVDYKTYEVLYVNQAFEELWGRSRKSLYEHPAVWLEAIHPEDLELVNEAFEKQQRTGEFDEEFRIIRPDGSVRWIHDYVVPIRGEAGEISRMVGIAEDITERRQAEDKVKDSLQEKEVLLKEINHRVKNNLQIISSLLNLQSRDIQDEQTLRSFRVSQDRIKSMALVHEKLYQSEDLARINFGEYIKSLADDLRSSYGLRSQNVKLTIDVDDTRLGVDTAIPCGVIVNELVSNSLKHAFPGHRPGEIVISFREVAGQYTMVFKDDGVGIPEDLDLSSPSSLGLTIVNALTGQLGGAIDIGRNGGTEISITFPAKQPTGELPLTKAA